ncbi:MAG: class A beta-lactamase-related serine hydrolase [Thermomicrobiales bacterium]|nr:class A beta-lactamase-related serine hydrolase [Thermomicrobiales bacterium]
MSARFFNSSCASRRGPKRSALALLVVFVPSVVLTACGKQSGSVETPPTATMTAEVAQVVTPIFTVPPTETPTIPPTPTVPPTPEFIDGVPTSPEQAATVGLLMDEPGVYGVAVLGRDGRVIVSHNAHVPFVTASTYKLLVMADILRKVEAGELSLEQTFVLEGRLFDQGGGDMYFATSEAGEIATLQDLLFAAGAFSSNVAGLTMLTLTSPESLRETAELIGMNDTWLLSDPLTLPNWPPQPAPDATPEDVAQAQAYIEASAQLGPVNITTPFDMATYMLELSNNTLISPFVSEQIKGILEEQLIRDRIPYHLPDGYTAMEKPGNLEDVVNDVGFITLPNGEVRSLALLSLDVPDDDHATQVEQRLALIAVGLFDLPPYDDISGATPAA